MSYVAGGAAAGLGKGLNEVGGEMAQGEIHQAILRMQQRFAQQQQQREFGQQRGMLAQQEQFIHGEKEREYEVQARAASLGRQFEKEMKGEQLDMERYRADRSYAARVDSALVRAAAASGTRGKQESGSWRTFNVNTGYPTNPDTGKPDLTAAPTQTPGLYNQRTGQVYAPQGGWLMRWDNQNAKPALPGRANNHPISDEEIRDLLTDPEGKIEDGPNAGMYKADVFELHYGKLPAQFPQALQRTQQQNQGSGSSASMSVPVVLTGGKTVNVPQATGPQAPEPAEVDTGESGTGTP